MIQMSVGEKYGVECTIRSGRRSIERLGFLAALEQTAIDENARLLCLNDVTGGPLLRRQLRRRE
jgi:hypothetical protein